MSKKTPPPADTTRVDSPDAPVTPEDPRTGATEAVTVPDTLAEAEAELARVKADPLAADHAIRQCEHAVADAKEQKQNAAQKAARGE